MSSNVASINNYVIVEDIAAGEKFTFQITDIKNPFYGKKCGDIVSVKAIKYRVTSVSAVKQQ